MKTKTEPALAPAILFSEKIIREMGTGKLSIINSFQKFTGPAIPFAVPPFVVTVSVCGFSGKGQHKLSVEVLGPSGEPIIPPVSAEVGTEEAVTAEEVFEFSFGMPALQFEHEGVHQIVLKIADKIAAQRSLPVILAPPAGEVPTPLKDEGGGMRDEG